METRLTDGQNFYTTRGSSATAEKAPTIQFSHNKTDKSGESLLTKKDKVRVDVGVGDIRFMSYDCIRSLAGFLGNLMADYDAHQYRAGVLEQERKEQEYKLELASWETSIRVNSLDTSSAVRALMSGQTVRLLENVLGDMNGNHWESYRLDDEGQVMCATSNNPQLHLSSHGPLSKTGKDKRWVTVPFPVRPQR